MSKRVLAIGTLAALLGFAALAVSGQQWSGITGRGATASFCSATLSANVALTANTPAQLTTSGCAVTVPNTGLTYRAIITGDVMFTSGGTNPIYAKGWVEDSSATVFDGASFGTTSGTLTNQSVNVSTDSGLYTGSGQTITFYPYAEINVGSQSAVAADQFGGKGTWLKVLLVPSS